MNDRPWTALRVAVLIAGLMGTAFWIGSLVQWWTIASSYRDGFELMGIVLSTVFFLVLVVPTLMLGVAGRSLRFAALLGIAVVALATDTLWSWLPW